MHLLNLTDVTVINDEQTYGGDWLSLSGVNDTELCDSFPTPYDNDYRGGDMINPNDVASRFAPDKPVFAQLPDKSFVLHDTRTILHENSLESPLMDGGGTSVLRSTIRSQRDGIFATQMEIGPAEAKLLSEQFYICKCFLFHLPVPSSLLNVALLDNDQNVALCVNEQPNFLNFDHCKLSFEDNVCVKEYATSAKSATDVQMVIKFDDQTLMQLHDVTSVSSDGIDRTSYLYAVDKLMWDESVNVNTTTLPCTPYKQPVSRWLPRPDLDATNCINSLQAQTVAALVHALESSNDDNEFLRDIYLWNDLLEDGCHEDDFEKVGMLIMTSDGCFENVHPDYL